MMKVLSKAENICALGLIVFFFLPWVSIGGLFNFAGYQLPNIASSIGRMGMAANGNAGMDPRVYYIYSVYLIPFLGLITLYLGMVGKNAKIFGVVAGLLPIVALAILLINNGSSVFDSMAIGAWLTELSAVVMLLSVFGIVKFPETKAVTE